MRRIALTLVALALAGGILAWLEHPAASGRAPQPGSTAPDFTLPDQNGQPVRLSEFRGKRNVVLAFYVKASTFG
jgi:cytochrome oxidase Cu insertion factor (SCO1/SenC/PrrC family)